VIGTAVSSKSNLDHRNLVVLRTGTAPKPKWCTRLLSLSPPIAMGLHNNDINTLEHAILERVFYVKIDGQFQACPRPIPGRIQEALMPFTREFRKHVFHAAPFSKEQFLDTYVGRKRKTYEEAFESLNRIGVSAFDARINAFVKAEKTNFTAKANPVPRVIQPRHPRYNARVGPYIKRIEKLVFSNIARIFHSKTVMKGLNALETGNQLRRKWDRFKDPVAIALDVSRFDQHVSREALQWEHSQYLLYFTGAERTDLRWLLQMQEENKGRGRTSDGSLKYSVVGNRMSGDMNTGLGNCLLMCAMIFAYLRHAGVTKFELANNGDDCSLIVERASVPLIEPTITPWFLDLGFEIVVEGVTHIFEQIKFCQCHPIWTPYGTVMVRNLTAAMAKDVMSLQALTRPADILGWRKNIGECGAALTSGVPIMQQFYQTLLHDIPSTATRRPNPGGLTGMDYMAMRMEARVLPIHHLTRVAFWQAFGLTPHHQEAIEAHLTNMTFNTSVSHNVASPTDAEWLRGSLPIWLM